MDMIRRIAVVVCAALVCAGASAQIIKVTGEKPKSGDVITGVVIGADGPMEEADVVERTADGYVVASDVTGEDGEFSFRVANPADSIFLAAYHDIAYINYIPPRIAITGSRFEIELEKYPPVEIDPSEFEELVLGNPDADYGPLHRGFRTVGDQMVWGYEYRDNLISYTWDDETGEALLFKAWDGFAEGSVIIPAEIVVDGKTYPVTAIAENALFYWDQVTSVSFSEGIEVIGDEAFCTLEESWFEGMSLESVTIPESVSVIGSRAFHTCPLKTVTVRGSKPFVCPENAFDASVYENAVLMLPKSWKRLSTTETGLAWSSFKHVKYYRK